MADVSASAAASNVVAIAAPTSGLTGGMANGTVAGAADSSTNASTSFGQHVSDSQATAKTTASKGQASGRSQASGTDATTQTDDTDTTDSAGVSQAPPRMIVAQVPLLTPAPAMASMELSGSAQDLSALSARMQKLMQVLQQQQPPLSLDTLTGNEGDAAQLSAALQKLGMSPADAAAEAGNITATLKAYKAKLGDAGVDTDKLSGAGLGTTIGGSTLGQIAAMMIAGSTNVPALDSTATLSGQVSLKINVSEANTSTVDGISGTAQAMVSAFAQQAAEVGRDMVGLGGQQVSGKGVAEAKQIMAVAEDEKTPIEVKLGQSAADVATAAAEATALPGAVAQATPQVTEPVKGRGTQSGATNKISGTAAASGGSKVASQAVLAPLKGEVLYKWQASAQGSGQADGSDDDVGTVTATPTAHKQMASLVNATDVKTDATGGAMAVAGTDTPLAQFADKLATAMRSNVTEQATVQLRGLSQGLQDGTVGGAAGTSGNADAGATGGQVRMLLNPPELGEIRIDLTVKDGSVHGTISASDTAVVSLLAREVHTLKHGLDQAGLKLGDQGINLMLSNSNQQGNQQSQQHGGQAAQGGNQSFGTELASDASDGSENALGAVSNPANWVSPDRVVDVRV